MAIFESGMTAEIELNGLAEKYSTRIEDVKNDYLTIHTPMKSREYLVLEPGK